MQNFEKLTTVCEMAVPFNSTVGWVWDAINNALELEYDNYDSDWKNVPIKDKVKKTPINQEDEDNHDNEVWSWITKMNTIISNIKTYEDLSDFIIIFKWEEKKLDFKYFVQFIKQLDENIFNIDYNSKLNIFKDIFWDDFQGNQYDINWHLYAWFICKTEKLPELSFYLWERLLKTPISFQESLKLRNHYTEKLFKNKERTKLELQDNQDISSNIKNINSIKTLLDFVKIFEWKDNKKLDVKYFTELIVKLKIEFKYLSLFSIETTLSKIFWTAFIDNISQEDSNTLMKYLEKDEVEEWITIINLYDGNWESNYTFNRKDFDPDNKVSFKD